VAGDRRQARLAMKVVRRAVVDKLDRGIRHQILPALAGVLEPVAGPGDLRSRDLASAHAKQPRRGHRGPEHAGNQRVGMGMGLADTRRPDEPHADLGLSASRHRDHLDGIPPRTFKSSRERVRTSARALLRLAAPRGRARRGALAPAPARPALSIPAPFLTPSLSLSLERSDLIPESTLLSL